MARKKKDVSDDDLSNELDLFITSIQEEIENAIREGFSLGANPKIVGYAVSIERVGPEDKKAREKKRQPPLFYEVIERKDAVILLVQFAAQPFDFDLAFDERRKQLILTSELADRSIKKRIPFNHSVHFNKKEAQYKNSVLEVRFPKKGA